MYKIITISGYTLAADGTDYVVLAPDGSEAYRDAHKLRAEARLRELIKPYRP